MASFPPVRKGVAFSREVFTLLNQRTSYTLAGQLIVLEQDDTLYYAHSDHLGSPTALMQKQGGKCSDLSHTDKLLS